jgi:hypothetical protein
MSEPVPWTDRAFGGSTASERFTRTRWYQHLKNIRKYKLPEVRCGGNPWKKLSNLLKNLKWK